MHLLDQWTVPILLQLEPEVQVIFQKTPLTPKAPMLKAEASPAPDITSILQLTQESLPWSLLSQMAAGDPQHLHSFFQFFMLSLCPEQRWQKYFPNWYSLLSLSQINIWSSGRGIQTRCKGCFTNLNKVIDHFSSKFWAFSIVICSVQSLGCVWLFTTPWTAAWQASLSITNSWSLLKLMSIESVMPSNHLILCRPLLLLSSIFPSIRVFSNESVLCNKWPKYWSFSFSISPSNEYSRLISSNLWPPPYMKYNQMKIVIGVNRTCILKWHVDIKKTF